MTSPLVSIIILTYQNGLPHVKKCLKSLLKVKYDNFEIILVDNGSTDETVKEVLSIRYKVLGIKLIKNKKNLGFAKANNQATKIAKGKYILFLNNDTEVTPGFLSILVRDLENDKAIGVVQPKIRQLLAKDKLDACASYLTNTGFLYHYGYSQNQSHKRFSKKLFMYSAKGACFLARKKLIDKIGLFDDDYFAYFEDSDFCHRVWLSGSKVLYEPLSEIYHLGGAAPEGSARRGPDKEVSPVIQFHSYKNRIATYIKNFEYKTLFVILPVHILICLVSCVLFLFLGKFLYSIAIVSAIFWNFLNINMLLSKRSFIQKKLRKIKDMDLLPEIKKNVKLSYYKHFLFAPRGTYDFEEI